MTITTNFWKKYIEMDTLERTKALKTLPLLKDMDKILLKIDDEEIRSHVMFNNIQGYIDDIIEYME